MLDRRLPFALLVAVLSTLGCSRGNAPAADPPAAKAGAPAREASPQAASGVGVAAEVNGDPILASELDAKTRSRLAPLRQQEYEIRQEALDELIADRLIAAEAQKRGVSRDELLRKEVEARAKVSDAEAEALYAQHKVRFADQPKANALATIRQFLGQRAIEDRRRAYVQELRAKARVAVRLEVPRTQVEVPANTPTTGAASAPVTIVEFTDYQCPFCHRAQAVMDQLMQRYKGRVRLVHLAFPLDGHPGAMPAAKAARCAAEQGKFLDYHRSLMTVSGTLDDADLKARAAKLGLKVADFDSCLAANRYEATIRASFQEGVALGVSGTPAYFINGRMLSGARPYEEFVQVIDAELAAR